MKIAIPTNDGLNLCQDFGHAKGYLILTVQLGKITGEELRWSKLSDILSSPDGLLAPIADCEAVLTNRIGPAMARLMEEKNKEVNLTTETIITNAYISFLENRIQKEANTCCCP